MARLPRFITMLAALALVAGGVGAQTTTGASGGGGTARAEDRERASQRLAAAIDRVRSRTAALAESGDLQELNARRLQEATEHLRRVRPDSPEFMAAWARMQALVGQRPFAIAVEEDEELKAAVKEVGRVSSQLAIMNRLRRPGYLGVSFASQQIVNQRGDVLMLFEDHPQIMSVEPESPAARAGLQRGDVLLAFDGKDVTRRPVAMNEILVPGRTVKVKVRREGRTMEVPLQVRQRPEAYRVFVRTPGAQGGGPALEGFTWTPEAPPAPPMPPSPPTAVAPRVRALPRTMAIVDGDLDVTIERRSLGDGASYVRVQMLGAELTQLDEDMREVLGAERGVLVFRVDQTSRAGRSGLRAGDVITRVGERRVKDPVEVYEVVRQQNGRGVEQVELEVVRKKKDVKVTLAW